VLFVNAAISRFNPISIVDEAFSDALFNINVRGAYFVMKPHSALLAQEKIDGATFFIDRAGSTSHLTRTKLKCICACLMN
jgi:hypothetical protein